MKQKIRSQYGVVNLVLIVIVVAVVVGVGTYVLTKSSNKKSSTNVTKSVQTVKRNEVLSQPKAASGDNLVISELGVSVPVPADLKGISYVVSRPPGANTSNIMIVKLNLDQYTKLGNQCTGAPDSTSQSFASLVKTNGQYDPSAQPPPQLLKQFDKFYIANIGSTLSANPKCRDDATQQQMTALTQRLSDALTSAFRSAEQTK